MLPDASVERRPLDARPGKSGRPGLLRRGFVTVDLAPGGRGESGHGQGHRLRLGRARARGTEHLEGAPTGDLGDVPDLERNAEIGLVTPEARHRFVVRYARERGHKLPVEVAPE